MYYLRWIIYLFITDNKYFAPADFPQMSEEDGKPSLLLIHINFSKTGKEILFGNKLSYGK